MAQHMIPAAQLVPKYQPIERRNNYVVLQSIPCSPECNIFGKILLDHPLSYVLTATTDVHAMYLQQFWRTVSNVPDTKDTIKFLLTEQFVYTVDMFRDTLNLLVDTPEKPFVTPANIQTIEEFMNRVGYQGIVDKVSAFYTKNLAQPWQTMFKVFNHCLTTRTSGHGQTKINILQLFHVVVNRTNVDYAALLWWDFMNNVFQKKEAIQYPCFIKLIIADLMKKFSNIPKRLEEDYHSIKDDVPLGRKRKQGTIESSLPKKSHKITTKRKKPSTTSTPPPSDDRERDEIAKAFILSLTLHKTSLAIEAQENIAKVQEQIEQEEIDKMFNGDEDEESNVSTFADSVFDDDVDDTGSKIEPESHKEHLEHVFDDDQENKKEKVNVEIRKEKIDDINVEESVEIVKEKDVVDVSDKTLSGELTTTVSPTTATTSKTSSTPKRKKKPFNHNTRNLPGSIAAMCR
nr:hypothetical protein [Tanacetum cinerariifolium]